MIRGTSHKEEMESERKREAGSPELLGVDMISSLTSPLEERLECFC